jgi:hypothetical protein
MATEIYETVVEIANTDQVSTVKGDYDQETIVEMFTGVFPVIANCAATVRIEDGVKYITFAERLGTKGAIA